MRKIIILTVAIITIILGIPIFFVYTYNADIAALYDSEISIEDIVLEEIGLTYCKLKIYIKISNPTNRDISGLTAMFDVYIGDSKVGLGSVSKVSIPGQSNRLKDVSVTIYYSDVVLSVVNGIKNRNFDLTIKGDASGDVLFGLITVSDGFIATKEYP